MNCSHSSRIHDMFIPYSLSVQSASYLTFSYKSSAAAKYILALSGNIRPPLTRKFSLAQITESNMPSNRRQKPIHSDIMMSTLGISTSSLQSSILLFTILIVSTSFPSSVPAIIWRAFSAIFVGSHAQTYLAPHLAASILKKPVPAPTSSTILSQKCFLLNSKAFLQ